MKIRVRISGEQIFEAVQRLSASQRDDLRTFQAAEAALQALPLHRRLRPGYRRERQRVRQAIERLTASKPKGANA